MRIEPDQTTAVAAATTTALADLKNGVLIRNLQTSFFVMLSWCRCCIGN
jgi:hypothetical protein